MGGEAVKKIDRKMLESASHEVLIDLGLQQLNTIDQLLEGNRLLRVRVEQLENEIRILKGEKKSQNFKAPMRF